MFIKALCVAILMASAISVNASKKRVPVMIDTTKETKSVFSAEIGGKQLECAVKANSADEQAKLGRLVAMAQLQGKIGWFPAVVDLDKGVVERIGTLEFGYIVMGGLAVDAVNQRMASVADQHVILIDTTTGDEISRVKCPGDQFCGIGQLQFDWTSGLLYGLIWTDAFPDSGQAAVVREHLVSIDFATETVESVATPGSCYKQAGVKAFDYLKGTYYYMGTFVTGGCSSPGGGGSETETSQEALVAIDVSSGAVTTTELTTSVSAINFAQVDESAGVLFAYAHVNEPSLDFSLAKVDLQSGAVAKLSPSADRFPFDLVMDKTIDMANKRYFVAVDSNKVTVLSTETGVAVTSVDLTMADGAAMMLGTIQHYTECSCCKLKDELDQGGVAKRAFTPLNEAIVSQSCEGVVDSSETGRVCVWSLLLCVGIMFSLLVM